MKGPTQQEQDQMLYLIPRKAETLTVEVLQATLNRARAGLVSGVVLTIREAGGDEIPICTGIYKERPSEGVTAALRASMLLTSIEETGRGKP